MQHVWNLLQTAWTKSEVR